jgi:hypothetical protein
MATSRTVAEPLEGRAKRGLHIDETKRGTKNSLELQRRELKQGDREDNQAYQGEIMVMRRRKDETDIRNQENL